MLVGGGTRGSGGRSARSCTRALPGSGGVFGSATAGVRRDRCVFARHHRARIDVRSVRETRCSIRYSDETSRMIDAAMRRLNIADLRSCVRSLGLESEVLRDVAS